MALLAKSGTPSLASLYPVGGQIIPGLKAAVGGILAGDICFIAADGTATKSDGTAANANATGFGIAAGDAAAGEAVTLYKNVIFHYGSGLTPGAPYYVAATAGRLDTAATTGGTAVVARAVDSTRILFVGNN
jgi:hypothetical protein